MFRPDYGTKQEGKPCAVAPRTCHRSHSLNAALNPLEDAGALPRAPRQEKRVERSRSLQRTREADMIDEMRRSPSGSNKRQRTHYVAVRCTPAELTILAAKAERAGLSRGAYLRAVALGSTRPRAARRPVVEKVELARLLGELGKVGSNLNQLARAANCGVSPALAELKTAVLAVERAASGIMKALGRDH